MCIGDVCYMYEEEEEKTLRYQGEWITTESNDFVVITKKDNFEPNVRQIINEENKLNLKLSSIKIRKYVFEWSSDENKPLKLKKIKVATNWRHQANKRNLNSGR